MFRVVTSRIVQILALALLVAPSGDAFTGFPAWTKASVTSEVAQGMMYRSRTLLQARSIMLESGSKIGYYLRGNSENPTTTPHAGIGFGPTLPRRLRGAGSAIRMCAEGEVQPETIEMYSSSRGTYYEPRKQGNRESVREGETEGVDAVEEAGDPGELVAWLLREQRQAIGKKAKVRH